MWVMFSFSRLAYIVCMAVVCVLAFVDNQSIYSVKNFLKIIVLLYELVRCSSLPTDEL